MLFAQQVGVRTQAWGYGLTTMHADIQVFIYKSLCLRPFNFNGSLAPKELLHDQTFREVKCLPEVTQRG